MKIREDFVTNSSSSSYVMAFKKTENGDKTTQLVDTLIDFILQSTCGYDTEEADIINNATELRDYIMLRYSWIDTTFRDIMADNDNRHFYDECRAYIEKGYSIAVKEVGYSDECLSSLMELLDEITDDFALLEKENE